MLAQLLKTRLLLLLLFLVAVPFTTAHAQSVNGGWLANNGDLLFMVKSTKNKVIVMDITAEKKLRYVFTGAMDGDQLVVATNDGATMLDATVTGQTLAGAITSKEEAPQDISAKLYFAYSGGNYDGVWKTDGAEDYLLYATLNLKGVVTTLVPYFSLHSDQTVTYNIFMGTPASTNNNGVTAYSGISMLDYSVLKLSFSSKSAADASLIKGQKIVKFTTSKTYAVTKKSGEF